MGARAALLGLTVAVLAETLRVSFPLLYHLAEQIGFVTAAGVVPLIYLAPFTAPLIAAAVGVRGLLVVGVGGLLASRLLTQIVSPVLWLAVVGTAVGLVGLVGAVWVARALPGSLAAAAAMGGLTLDTAVRLTFSTWDASWQSGLKPWLACLTVVGGGVAALLACLRASPPPGSARERRVAPVVAVGPFLALELLVLSSPAFVASSGELSLAAAGAVVLAGQALALGVLALPVLGRALPPAAPMAAGVLLALIVGALTGANGLTGPAAVAAVLAGQVIAVGLLGLALRAVSVPAPVAGSAAGTTGAAPLGEDVDRRFPVAMGLGSLVFVAVLLLYQIHYELPLPFPNEVLPAGAAIVLGLAGAAGARRAEALTMRPVVAGAGVALALQFVPLGLAVTAPERIRPATAEDSFRLVDYNIHEAVDVRGRLDPEAIAEVIEAEGADVVLLQEVGRGWPLSGMTDVGEWLSRRLGMRLVYGPAADNQFGNAVLTRLPVAGTGTGTLPAGEGPMTRGYVFARLGLGGGAESEVTAWSAHLQHRDDRTATRIQQIDTLREAWNRARSTVIAGDLNAELDSPEMRRLLAGTDLHSAQDDAGRGELPTARSDEPDHRIDWILGTREIVFSDFVIPRATASDHLPLAVTVRLPGSSG